MWQDKRTEESKTIRLFVAIELPREVQESLVSVQRIAGQRLSSTRWIEAKNLHLTLQFLGNCPSEQVVDICQQLKIAVQDKHPFAFKFESLGGFPSNKSPRIFWIGVGEGKEKIADLQHAMESALSSLGFKGEKREFHPHVTLARLKKPEDLRPILEEISAEDISPKPINVDSIALFRSQLLSSGAQYFILEKIFLEKD